LAQQLSIVHLQLKLVALGGHLDLCSLSYFIKLGATDFDYALASAASGGQLNLDLCSLSYFIKNGAGATDFNYAHAHAACGG